MNKFALKLMGVGSVTFLLAGCSTFFTDHSNDYQLEKPVTSTLEVPAGSSPTKDVLVIPNEKDIANLDGATEFKTPRAPFIFYPMVAINVDEQEGGITLTVPADLSQSKRMVSDFLTALYGEGQPIESQTDNQITSVPFDFHPEGWLASLWSNITRLYPAKTAFLFSFKEVENKTLVTVQFRDVVKDAELGDWMSPVQNDDAYEVAVRLWGTMGRQLNQASAYLSNLDNTASFPIWVDHQGLFSVYLGKDVSKTDLEAKLNSAGMYLMPSETPLLAPVPPEDVARIGDVIDFNIPGSQQKLFNVRRRNLDDVSWEQREYPYTISHQKAGDFLVIDVSAVDSPEVVSYHLVQRFIN